MGIEIISFNYFGEKSESTDWNAKVVYKKYDKSYHCLLHIDYFNKRVSIPKPQPIECKALSGIAEAIKTHLKL